MLDPTVIAFLAQLVMAPDIPCTVTHVQVQGQEGPSVGVVCALEQADVETMKADMRKLKPKTRDEETNP